MQEGPNLKKAPPYRRLNRHVPKYFFWTSWCSVWRFILIWQTGMFISSSIIHSSKIQRCTPSEMHSCISNLAQLQSVSSLASGQSAILSQYFSTGIHTLLSSMHLFTIDLHVESNGARRQEALHISSDVSWQSILPSQILSLTMHWMLSAHFAE